jgi:hypothetical protein
MIPASNAPEAQAHALVERVAQLLDECHALRGPLETAPEAGEGASAEAVRVLYFALTSALEVALTRALEDVLTILRHASQPLGPMGAEWLERQERVLKREGP